MKIRDIIKAKKTSVICIEATKGTGENHDPIRAVSIYYTLGGVFLCEIDDTKENK